MPRGGRGYRAGGTVVAAPAGDTDATRSYGTDSQTFTLALLPGGPPLVLPFGTENESFDHTASPRLSLGSSGASQTFTETGSASRSLGTSGESLTHTETSTVPLGTTDASLDVSNRTATVPLGSGGASLVYVMSAGVATRSYGVDGASQTFTMTGGVASRSLGTGGASMAVTAVATVRDRPTGSVEFYTSGKHWLLPDNVKDNDDDEASITADSTITAADGYNSQMHVNGLLDPPMPSGFALTNFSLLVRHRWDVTVDALETVTHTVQVLRIGNPTDLLLATPFTVSEGGGGRAALATDTFDITSSVSGQTEVARQSLLVKFNATSSLLLGVASNCSWAVAWVAVVQTWTRTGIT